MRLTPNKYCDTNLVYQTVYRKWRLNYRCDTNLGIQMLEGKGRVINRASKTGKKTYDKYFIYIPTEVARDGLFPFKDGEEVIIKVGKNMLTVKKK